MSADSRSLLRPAHVRRHRCLSSCWWFALWSLAIALPGCGGCHSDDKPDDDKQAPPKKVEKPKENFEQIRFLTLPSDYGRLGIKPGHWSAGMLEMRANNFDHRGQLIAELRQSASGQPFDIEETTYRLETSRPAILPKAQLRDLEFNMFCPPTVDGPFASTQLHLTAGQTHADVYTSPNRTSLMLAHQYYFVVLARNWQDYAFLEDLDCVNSPSGQPEALVTDGGDGQSDDPQQGGRDRHYLVRRPLHSAPLPLPLNPLCWSSLAYILWDDCDPSLLTPGQQQSLIDWLNWGGQLVISGPKSLEILRETFLEPYLPAHAGASWEIGEPELAVLNNRWRVGEDRLVPVKPWSGVELLPTPGASVPTGFDAGGKPLLVERRVGRGRVIASAFSLAQNELVDWDKSVDQFFNAVLLRRSKRYIESADGLDINIIRWPVSTKFEDVAGPIDDPQRVTQVRYFTRDAAGEQQDRSVRLPMMAGNPFGMDPLPAATGPGVAAWNDRSQASNYARIALREAAGIVVPDSSFVVKILVAYLVVLVPLNWLLFRLIGRVELAWAAAPVIAIVCTGCVVWLAQLDIGFARARSEIGIVELYGGYPRAHVTRYTALYSSLGTDYEVLFDDPAAVALPFSTLVQGEKLLAGQARTTVDLHRGRAAGAKEDDDTAQRMTLRGYEVSSNTTGMLHSEQMLDLGGKLEMARLPSGEIRVTNNTPLKLSGAILTSGKNESAWLGELGPGESREAELNFGPADNAWNEHRDESELTAEDPPEVGIHIGPLVELALGTLDLKQGEVRLVAWTSDEIPGVTISPAVAQSRQANLIVAHLELAAPLEPRPDIRPQARNNPFFRRPR